MREDKAYSEVSLLDGTSSWGKDAASEELANVNGS
jgi:hypothetical protein